MCIHHTTVRSPVARDRQGKSELAALAQQHFAARRRVKRFSRSPAGAVLLWLTLDWPVGPLGTGYLASVHPLQFISLAMVVPPVTLNEGESCARTCHAAIF